MDRATPTLVIDRDGDRPTVTKSATGPGVARLRVEAAILAAARHPGVVALVEPATVDEDGTVRVRTRFAGSRTLANAPAPDPARAAAVVAALAGTVADLHDLGIVHGRLTPDHVILAADGRPILCGLAEATYAGRGSHRPPDDVAALGELLRTLVATAPPEVEEAPRRRLHRRPVSIHLRGALLNLADQATADETRRRPTARHLAQTVSATVAERPAAPRRPAADAASHRDDPAGRRPVPTRRALVGAGTVVAVMVAVAVVAAVAGRGSEPEPGVAEAASLVPEVGVVADPITVEAFEPMTPPTFATSATLPTTSTVPWPPEPEPPDPTLVPAAGCAAPGSDGSGVGSTADGLPCPTPLRVEDTTISIGEVQFRVGTGRPAVAIGDFACSGRVAMAILDLDRGHVFAFRRLGGLFPSFGTSIAHVESPRRLLAEPSGDGCHRLVVLDTWGLRHVIDVPDPEEEP